MTYIFFKVKVGAYLPYSPLYYLFDNFFTTQESVCFLKTSSLRVWQSLYYSISSMQEFGIGINRKHRTKCKLWLLHINWLLAYFFFTTWRKLILPYFFWNLSIFSSFLMFHKGGWVDGGGGGGGGGEGEVCHLGSKYYEYTFSNYCFL